jgi:hypothetical protein
VEVTEEVDVKEVAKAAAVVPSPVDAHTVTRASEVHSGRPDLAAIVASMRELALSHGEKRVAVLSCGPEVMVAQLRRLCREKSGGGVTFDFHGELFEF